MKISIIVPVYNVENELERCVDSLINQTYKNLEIILVDDGSTDNSPALCDKYKNIDNRIKVIHKENGGLSDARNCGINNSTGDFLLFVDSDDYILADSCEKFINQVEDDVDIVVGEAKLTYPNKVEYQRHTALEENKKYSSKEYIISSINNNEFYSPICFNLYRRSYILNNNLFFKKGIYHEDTEILLRMYLNVNKIKCLRYEFYQYIIRENSINGNKKDYTKNINDSFNIYADWKKYIDNIDDLELRKKLYCILSRYIIVSCKRFNVKKGLPNGIDNKFLLKNCLNKKEYLKALLFVYFRRMYIKM